METAPELAKLLAEVESALEEPELTLDELIARAGPALLRWHLAAPADPLQEAAWCRALYDHPTWREAQRRFGDLAAIQSESGA